MGSSSGTGQHPGRYPMGPPFAPLDPLSRLPGVLPILAGLIHDLGKLLCCFGEPQWAVVGDTFPVGCAFSDKVVFPEFFAANPDARVPQYQTTCGVYNE